MQCVWNPIQEGREACSRQKLNNLRWWFIGCGNSGWWKLLQSSSSLSFVVAVVGSSEHTKSSVLLAGAGDGISVRWWRHGCLLSVLELMLGISETRRTVNHGRWWWKVLYHRLSPKVNQAGQIHFILFLFMCYLDSIYLCFLFMNFWKLYIYIYTYCFLFFYWPFS